MYWCLWLPTKGYTNKPCEIKISDMIFFCMKLYLYKKKKGGEKEKIISRLIGNKGIYV